MSNARDDTRLSDDDIVALARSVEPHDFERIDPPAQVWNNVLTELEVEVASREATARRVNQRWFSSSHLLSAAAATLVMVGVAVAVVMWTGDDEPLITEVAAAAMNDEGLPVSTPVLADATFECEDDTCFVEVNLTRLPDAGTDNLELWVINGDVSDMHPLGNITGTTARFKVPAGVTVDEFPIVDISLEPDDGDPTHSGQSVLRGIFEA